jgi:hypothetical protein
MSDAAGACCVSCGSPIGHTVPAIVFPCGHAWREDCLERSGGGADAHAQCLLCGDAVIATIDLPFDY